MVLLSRLVLRHPPPDAPFPRSFLTLFCVLHSFLHLSHALALPLGPRALRQNLLRSLPGPSFPGWARSFHPSRVPGSLLLAGDLAPGVPSPFPPPGGSPWAPGSRASLFVQRPRRRLPALFAKLSAPPRRAGPIKSHSLFSAPVSPGPQPWLGCRFVAPLQP